MNCPEIKLKLIDLLYNELPAEQREQVQQHLTQCADCRREWENLQHSGEQLEMVPREASASRVDIVRLQQTATTRLERSRRRWRWSATATTVTAAVALLFVVSGTHIEWHDSHLVVAWGELPMVPEPPQQPADWRPALQAYTERLDGIDELVSLTARELLQTDRQHYAESIHFGRQLAEIQTQFADSLQQLQTQSDLRWQLILEDLSQQRQAVLAQLSTSDLQNLPSDETGARP